MSYFRKKIASQRGESITEVLVAVLITSLAVLVFATMVSASTRIIRSGEKKMNKYYEDISVDPGNKSEESIAFSDGNSQVLSVNGDSEKNVTLYKNSEGTALFYTGDEP
ncbi:MAG: hypothetical protein ACI4EB_06745 [Bilifractor sp.]